MTQLSPAAEAIWEAFNAVAERVGVFEDHGDAIAAALRALADQVVPHLEEPDWGSCNAMQCDIELYTADQCKRLHILAISDELKGR